MTQKISVLSSSYCKELYRKCSHKEDLQKYIDSDSDEDIKIKKSWRKADLTDHYVKRGFHMVEKNIFNYDDRSFKFEGNVKNLKKHDFANAKKFYEAFHFLSPSEAADERLWVRLSHNEFAYYTANRWTYREAQKNGKNIANIIKDRSFFVGKGLRAKVNHAVARLWWIPHLTICDNSKNDEEKWRFTKLVFNSQQLLTDLFQRKLGTYENVRFASLEFLHKFRMDNGGKKMEDEKIKKLFRRLNNSGGVQLLSIMEKDQIKSILEKIVKTF